jgi:hypothetical protein
VGDPQPRGLPRPQTRRLPEHPQPAPSATHRRQPSRQRSFTRSSSASIGRDRQAAFLGRSQDSAETKDVCVEQKELSCSAQTTDIHRVINTTRRQLTFDQPLARNNPGHRCDGSVSTVSQACVHSAKYPSPWPITQPGDPEFKEPGQPPQQQQQQGGCEGTFKCEGEVASRSQAGLSTLVVPAAITRLPGSNSAPPSEDTARSNGVHVCRDITASSSSDVHPPRAMLVEGLPASSQAPCHPGGRPPEGGHEAIQPSGHVDYSACSPTTKQQQPLPHPCAPALL